MVGEEEWPQVAESLHTAGIWPINDYIQWKQDTVAVHVDFQPIYELCTG